MTYDNLDDLTLNAKSNFDASSENAVKALGSPDPGEAPKAVCAKILTHIGREAGTNASPADVFSATAFLLQKGATSPRTPGNKRMEYGTAAVSVDLIRKACRMENNTTVRQFARGIKEKAIELFLYLGEFAPEGNLAKNMKLDLRNVTHEEALWASDFQTYNEDCPFRVRKWLTMNYRARFRK